VLPLRKEIGDPLRDDAGFSRTGASKDEQGPVDMEDGLALFGVECV